MPSFSACSRDSPDPPSPLDFASGEEDEGGGGGGDGAAEDMYRFNSPRDFRSWTYDIDKRERGRLAVGKGYRERERERRTKGESGAERRKGGVGGGAEKLEEERGRRKW